MRQGTTNFGSGGTRPIVVASAGACPRGVEGLCTAEIGGSVTIVQRCTSCLLLDEANRVSLVRAEQNEKPHRWGQGMPIGGVGVSEWSSDEATYADAISTRYHR